MLHNRPDATMTQPVLIAYASGSGSTREVAAAMGATLNEQDIETDVRGVNEVESLQGYRAVIAGSSIRLGRWLPEAVAFISDFSQALGDLPVAYFTTCLTMIEDTPENRATVMAYMEPILALAPRVKPIAVGLFAGSLNPTLQQLIPAEVGPYGDHRDWAAIRRWAASLGEVLRTAPAPDANATQDNAFQDEADAWPVTPEYEKAADESGRAPGEFFWTQMPQADLRGALLEGANLIGANLTGADLTGAVLRYAILNGSTLTQAVLYGADLSGADLHWADLRGADLREANLQFAMLGWSDLRGADLTDARLSLARYNEHTRWPEGFSPEEAGCRFMSGTG